MSSEDFLENEQLQRSKSREVINNILLILFSICLFFIAIDLLSSGFGFLGGQLAESILRAASNPFIGLFIGMLATALIQSSSTTTSTVVAMVAAGTINYSTAVPIVMGANVGTTITSSIVSLGYIVRGKEFRKALSAGVVHDFFNFFAILIFFPLEYKYGFISGLAQSLGNLILPGLAQTGPANSAQSVSGVFSITQVIAGWLNSGVLILLLSFVMLFVSIKLLSKSIYRIFLGGSNSLAQFIFENPFKSFAFGTLITAAFQSSSLTTSLAVPMVATGRIQLKRMFPFIMGANVGTTITAFIATLFQIEAVLVIALAHLLFNVFGVMLFLPFPVLRNLPVRLAQNFGRVTMKYRIIGFIYVIFTFFVLPFTLIYLSRGI